MAFELEPRDRRRVVVAALVSLVALPALWVAARNDNSAAPNTASVGVEVGASAAAQSNSVPLPDPGQQVPAFLSGPEPIAPGIAQVAVPGEQGETFRADATYSGDVPSWLCVTNVVQSGLDVTVVNLDNNRSVTCQTQTSSEVQDDVVVLGTSLLANLADITEVPLSVELRL